MSTPPRPPYDPELKTVMDQAFADGMPLHFDIDDLPAMREGASFGASLNRPSLCRQVALMRNAPLLDQRRYPAPIPFEEPTSTQWIGASLVELSIDPARLLLAGTSGGGAICAGVTLLGRERGGPKVCGQLLIAPMLDDRRGSISARQFEDEGGHWSSRSNRFAWRCVLGSRSGTPDVKDFEAPGRATDLSGLRPHISRWGQQKCVEMKSLLSRANYGKAACRRNYMFGQGGGTISLPTHPMPRCPRRLCVQDTNGSRST
ncbi:Alpha/Beta hydrolase fold [Phytophthora cactorum]|nr:Alpha/Beta hydrolase fold [Phytophthora cactorum]